MRVVTSRTDVEHVVSVEFDEPVLMKRSWSKNDAGMVRLTVKANGVVPDLDRVSVSGTGFYFKKDGTLGAQRADGNFLSLRSLPDEVVKELRDLIQKQADEHLAGR